MQSKIICPECRKEAIVPAGGVKDLPNNFFNNRMVDELVLKRKVEGEEVKCDECDEDEPVVAYCPECNSFLCQFCYESHKRSKRFRSHKLILLNKEVAQLGTWNNAKCKDHDEQLKYYCETCEQLVCMYCTVKEHNGHNHDTVKKMATKHRNELKEVTAPVDEMIRDLSEAHDNIDKMRKKIRQQGDEVDKKIDQHYDELIQKLMKQKEKLKQQGHDAVSQKEKALRVQLEEVKYAQAEVLSMKELKDAIEKSSDQEALSAKKQVIDRMQQITDQFNKLNTDPLRSATMEYICTKKSFPQFGRLCSNANPDPHSSEVINLPEFLPVGKKLKVIIVTKDSNGECCSTGGSEVSVQLESGTGEVRSVQVRDKNDGRYMATFIAQKIGEVKLSISINGQQIKGSPYSIITQYNFSSISKPTKIVNNDGNMGQPWGIAFGGKNGVWAVADFSKHCVYVFDEQDQLIRKIGHHISSSMKLKEPVGVAFDGNNNLYVTNHHNNTVYKFEVSGRPLLWFGTGGSGDGNLNGPLGIATHNCSVFIADRNNSRISVFRSDGQFSHTIGTRQLMLPYDVIVNNIDQLLVADYGEHCIYAFTLDGNFVHKFGIHARCDSGQLGSPCSITADCNGYIIVAEYGNNCVSIFDEDGNCLYCFGSPGCAPGEFQKPHGIALSPNGSIYVSDSNNRVQIFTNF